MKAKKLAVIAGSFLLSFAFQAQAQDQASPPNSLVVDDTGFVGIGTATPVVPLHVVESTGADANVLELENDSGVRFILRNSSAPLASSNDWLFSAINVGFRITRLFSGGAEFNLDNDGNLTLRGQLTVCNDAAICTPTTGFPDYVFKDDYTLMPLDELSNFIAENKRLPNVPTLEDVGKDGINMTTLQWKLLEKVEELTLYTLNQELTIQELQKRLAALEQEK